MLIILFEPLILSTMTLSTYLTAEWAVSHSKRDELPNTDAPRTEPLAEEGAESLEDGIDPVSIGWRTQHHFRLLRKLIFPLRHQHPKFPLKTKLGAKQDKE